MKSNAVVEKVFVNFDVKTKSFSREPGNMSRKFLSYIEERLDAMVGIGLLPCHEVNEVFELIYCYMNGGICELYESRFAQEVMVMFTLLLPEIDRAMERSRRARAVAERRRAARMNETARTEPAIKSGIRNEDVVEAIEAALTAGEAGSEEMRTEDAEAGEKESDASAGACPPGKWVVDERFADMLAGGPGCGSGPATYGMSRQDRRADKKREDELRKWLSRQRGR